MWREKQWRQVYFESQKGGQQNKFGRCIDKGDCGTKEMSIFVFIYFVELLIQPIVAKGLVNLQGLNKKLLAL
jgi:hypothetical protein